MKPSQNQTGFLTVLLAAQALGVFIYTILVINGHGLGLFDVFLNDILQVNWSGQFNVDFSSYLLLSGLWIVWRNQFSTSSLLLAPIATIMGIIVFAPYVLYLVMAEKGDLKKVLVGHR